VRRFFSCRGSRLGEPLLHSIPTDYRSLITLFNVGGALRAAILQFWCRGSESPSYIQPPPITDH
jgi:hypothetical protein